MNEIVPEFSRTIQVSRLSPKGVDQDFHAKPAERVALAKRFDLIELSALEAQLILKPDEKESIVITGTVSADIVQRCVVTLEPISTHIDTEIDTIFFPEHVRDEGEDLSFADDMDSEVDFFAGDKIDIGELVAQQLGIAINPYPRKKGAMLPKTEFGSAPVRQNPLSALAAALQQKGKKIDK